MSQEQSGWLKDPTNRFELRFWDGSKWTEHVVSNKTRTTDLISPFEQISLRNPVRQAPPTPPTPQQQERRINSPLPPQQNRTPQQVPQPVRPPQQPLSQAPQPVRPNQHNQNQQPQVQQTPPTRVPQQHSYRSTPHSEPSHHNLVEHQQLNLWAQESRNINFFNGKKHAIELYEENKKLIEAVNKYGLKTVIEVNADLERARQELNQVGSNINNLRNEDAGLRASIINMRDVSLQQEFGLYDYESAAEDSLRYKQHLDDTKERIKVLIKNDQAVYAAQGFTYNNSAREGNKFVQDMKKLMLRAYNAEAENCVKATKAGRTEASVKRLETAVRQIEKLGKLINLRIAPEYHSLRVREIKITDDYLEALRCAKEYEREKREELKEKKKVEQEIAERQKELVKEKTHYENALKTLKQNGDIEAVARMEEKLEEIEITIEDINTRASGRAGYVYVVSNIGAFGESIVKIGLTRRLEPMDRIKELGGASVPFHFDVHALFFSEDAVAVETQLHRAFTNQRVNKVNMRKEYFYVTPNQVLDYLKNANVTELMEFNISAPAEEYRQSVGHSIR